MQYERMSGRKKIYTPVNEITQENVIDVIRDVLPIHFRNADQIHFLDYFEKGKQPILHRKKNVRPEINNKIVENHAHEIVEFKVGYMFGSPVSYVQRASDPNEGKDNRDLTYLNEMLFEEGKSYKDQELANMFNKVGIGYRGIFPVKREEKTGVSLFKIVNMRPHTTFLIRKNDIYETVIAGVSYQVIKNTKGGNHKYIFGVYTNKYYYTFEADGEYLQNIINFKIRINGIGTIPIVEYINDYDRMGSFERVIPLLNALNMATSDRINGLEQFIQSLLWLNNVDIDEKEFPKLREVGGIKTKSTDSQTASIKFLTEQLNQNEVQTLAEYLYDQILQISGIPGREQSTGGNTGQAIMLGGSGWQLAETSAKKQELLFAQSERESLKVIKAIIEKANDSKLKTININDIDIKFTRNKVSNLLTKTQGLMNQLSAGINPRVAIANCDLYGDPEQVYRDSLEYLKKWLIDGKPPSNEEPQLEKT